MLDTSKPIPVRKSKYFRPLNVRCLYCIGWGTIIYKSDDIEHKNVFKVMNCTICCGTGLKVIPIEEINNALHKTH